MLFASLPAAPVSVCSRTDAEYKTNQYKSHNPVVKVPEEHVNRLEMLLEPFYGFEQSEVKKKKTNMIKPGEKV